MAALAKRTGVRSQARLFLFALPALVLVVGAFGLPVVLALLRSVENGEFRGAFPHTAVLLRQWDGAGLPAGGTQHAFATELAAAARTAISAPHRAGSTWRCPASRR